MRRSTKYLNAREYAERLILADNPDVADFGRDFIEALDDYGQAASVRSETLGKIEEMIEGKYPEYDGVEISEAIADMLTRLRPKPVYDL